MSYQNPFQSLIGAYRIYVPISPAFMGIISNTRSSCALCYKTNTPLYTYWTNVAALLNLAACHVDFVQSFFSLYDQWGWDLNLRSQGNMLWSKTWDRMVYTLEYNNMIVWFKEEYYFGTEPISKICISWIQFKSILISKSSFAEILTQP